MGLPLPQKKPVQNANPKSAIQKPQQQAISRSAPTVGAFAINAKLKSDLKEVVSALRTVSFLTVSQEKSAVNGLYVESRDINKKPYVFSILKLTEDSLELVYSIPPGVAPIRRRLDMVRYFINLLTVLEPFYSIDQKIVLQLMENSIKDVTDSVSMDSPKLYTEYDTLKKEVDDLKKKVKRLSDENNTLSNDNYELKNRNDELLLRLKQLENIPDDALKAKIQEWVADHNGEINISEFAKLNNVNEVRVEEMLNVLITEGYIESVQ